MTVPASIFRMYDIRGRVADELTPEAAETGFGRPPIWEEGLEAHFRERNEAAQ